MSIALTEQQAAVVSNRGGNLLVSAAAGSGKTRVLVERLMQRVREGADIDRFLVITFTNAAAAELRDRVAKAVSEELSRHPGDRHLRRNATLVWQAPIETIDSFCLNFLRQCGASAGLDPDFRICDQAEGAALGQEALEEVLERRYERVERDPGFAALVEELAEVLGDQTLESVILDVHSRVQSHADPLRWLTERKADWDFRPDCRPEDTPWGRVLLEDAGDLAAYWAGELGKLRRELHDDPVLENNYGASLDITIVRLRALCLETPRGWDAVRALLPVPFPRVGNRRGADPAFKGRVQGLRDLCKKQLSALEERFAPKGEEAMEDLRAVAPAMTALLDVVAEYDGAFTEKKRRHLLDFADGEHLTAKLLTENPALAAEWGRRYVEIMVDEYQDTNTVQNVIFDALSTGDNLFLVGDVKQSIYRFRLADPTIFLGKYAAYPDYRQAKPGEGRTIHLSANFRSRPEVLEGTNFLFRNIMTRSVGELDYTDAEALIPGRADLPPDPAYQVELNCLNLDEIQDTGSDGQAPDKDLLEARAVAARIAALLREGFPVGGRPVTPEDIVILLRSPTPVLPYYTQALDEAGIPWQTDGAGEFFHTTEISTALSLLRIVDNPRQDVPLLSVLRSPLYGFTPDRLALLRAGSDGSIYDCLVSAAERGDDDCARFLAELNGLRDLSCEVSSDQLIWRVYEQTGLLTLFSGLPEGARRRENLLALHDAARGFESAGHKGLFGFLAHLERVVRSGQSISRPQSGAGVKILSIHRSKGLEFPVVFLCALERQFNDGDTKTPILFHEKLGLGPKHTDRARGLRYTTIARDAVALRLRQQLRAEEMRLLYVAMTRAVHKLFLFASVNGRANKLESFALQAACPPPPRLMGQANSMLPWVLTPALCRAESGQLWAGLEAERPNPPAVPGPAWDIRMLPALSYRKSLARQGTLPQSVLSGDGSGTALEGLSERLCWTYPHAVSTEMASKFTATQLKGREKDEEAAEEAVGLFSSLDRPTSDGPETDELAGSGARRTRWTMRRPVFEGERPLTATERGTALHMAMQYLNYARTGSLSEIREEIARLVAGQYITPAQGAAVNVDAIRTLFASPLGQRLKYAPQVEREFKFSLLVPATDYVPEAEPGEELLLQGVVDCWFREADGAITVVDFKTDRVTDRTILGRAEHYRPQLEAYSRALREVMDEPVSHRILWFFALGRGVEV